MKHEEVIVLRKEFNDEFIGHEITSYFFLLEVTIFSHTLS